MSTIDWSGLMSAGLRGLRLSHAQFWALTPAELAFLLGPEGSARPLGQAQLEALSRRFPDKPEGETHG